MNGMFADLELSTPAEAASGVHTPAGLFHVAIDGIQYALLRIDRDHHFGSIGLVAGEIPCAFLQHGREHAPG